MVKRILKIVSIILASFIVVTGAVVGVVALTGGFNKEEINITKLYFGDDESNNELRVKTLEDFTTKINYLPKNATNTKLKVTINGNENGIIENIGSINAGQDIKIKVNKDTKGNNIGGVVTIELKQGIAPAKLTVIVDSAIPDDSIYFTGNTASKLTLSGKSFTMPISRETQYVYLKSSLINAFYLQADNQNMKKAYISYTYYDKNGNKINGKSKDLSDELVVDSIADESIGKNVYFYKIPIVTDVAGHVEINAKMHRTSIIDSEFYANEFDKLVSYMTNDPNGDKTHLMLLKYNQFLNDYVDYFDNTLESYSFFKKHIPLGKIELYNLEDVKESLEYVFVSCSAKINITAIKLKDFTSTDTPTSYNVFTQNVLGLSGDDNKVTNVIDKFKLKITTNAIDPTIDDAVTDSKYLFENTLNMAPYLYVDKGTEDNPTFDSVAFDGEYITWESRKYKYINVYGFKGHTPITQESEESIHTGYLLKLEDQDEYMAINKVMVNNKQHWNLSCNVPLPNNTKNAESSSQSFNIYKALYIGFSVSGMDEENNQIIEKNTFSRIYIEYDDYEFVSNEIDNLTLNEMYKLMAINTTTLIDDAEGNLAPKRNKQTISIDTSDIKQDKLTPTPSYTSIMYFVESTSNLVNGYKKVATVGKYKFLKMKNVNSASILSDYPSDKYYCVDEDNGDVEALNKAPLIGERILTYDDNKNYYLHALNASTEPVKVFAVAYLSDENGDPIDINGRKLTIKDEDALSEDNAAELVVIRITEYTSDTMTKIEISNYVDNINFYTNSQTEYSMEIDEDESVEFGEGALSRNTLNYYLNNDGEKIDAEKLLKINNFLQLKLISEKNFDLYLSNFELNEVGEECSKIDEDEKTSSNFEFADVFGNKMTSPITYKIAVDNNKQIAFNNLCKNIGDCSLIVSGDSEAVTNASKIGEVISDGDNCVAIKYTLSTSKNNGKINLDVTDNDIPYSTQLGVGDRTNDKSPIQKCNWISYIVNKLEVETVDIAENNSMQNKLYAKYNSEDDRVYFTADRSTNDEYSLDMNMSEGFSSIDYSVETNFTKLSDTGTPVYDLDIVDVSQIDDLEEYIALKTTGIATGNSIGYTNTGVVTIKSDAEFNNINKNNDYDNNIYFGTKVFAKDGSYVNINGYSIPVQEEGKKYYIKINAGQVFPLIADKYVLIYNELFELNAGDGNQNYFIYGRTEDKTNTNIIYVEKGATLVLSNGNVVNYDANEYLKSDTNTSAIIIEGDSATVNFLHGETLANATNDAEGECEYKLVVEEGKSRYVKLSDEELLPSKDGGYAGDRYKLEDLYDTEGCKKGVTVYLLVTFNLTGKNFYKAIEYELVQQDIIMTGYNEDNTINSSLNPYKVEKGEYTITLNSSSDNTPYIYLFPDISGDDYYEDTEKLFRDMVNLFDDVEVTSNNSTYLSVVKNGVNIVVTIGTPPVGEKLSISLSYKDPKTGILYSGDTAFKFYFVVTG